MNHDTMGRALDTPDRTARATTLLWLVTSLVVFLLMITFGITMRLAQGEAVDIELGTFYALMTMHGLGMVGSMFSAGLAIIWFIAARHTKLSVGLMRFALALFVAGAVGLLVATLIGRFGAGWYALYPLPFVNPTWPQWSIGLAIISLMLLGVSWLVCQLDILRGLAARFGVSRLLGWQYLGSTQPSEELPAPVLVVVICAVAGTLGTLVGAATFAIYLFKWFVPAAQFDALLLKNSMFMFGHVIANLAMYCGIASVYAFLPAYTNRPWRLNRITVLAWNATLVFILGAYFHHLYQDFVQVEALQYLGQIFSYLSAIPATAVTVLGVGSQLFGAGLRWTFTPLAFFLGILGWVIGGIAAVVDSTIIINQVFHNTLWVPGHFHTYFLVGFVFIMLGFFHRLVGSKSERLATISLWTMVVGGYGFVLMFYLGGMQGVPRRFSNYRSLTFGDIDQIGAQLALGGAVFATLFLLGAIGFTISLIGRRGREPAAG